jgi:hypothetical protein
MTFETPSKSLSDYPEGLLQIRPADRIWRNR